MNSSIKLKRNVRSKKKVAVVIFLFVVILALSQFSNINPFSSLLHTLVRPVWITGNIFSEKATTFFGLLNSKRNLIDENERLKAQLRNREAFSDINNVLVSENRELQELLGRNVTDTFVVGRVLARPNVTLYDTFIIDVGKRDSVMLGDRVVAENYFVIGDISDVFNKTSIVTMFSAPGKRTNVILGPTNILVVAEGLGGGNFTTKLPRGVDIEVGDNISLADIGVNIFGQVENIIATPAGQFQTILFKNPVNMAELRFVRVVR
ncbi:rod shape-determining protein MreC [Patescibacteria group bacterium]|nr:rod shape-determining protein MreC [Patescibacteria group bacterium]